MGGSETSGSGLTSRILPVTDPLHHSRSGAAADGSGRSGADNLLGRPTREVHVDTRRGGSATVDGWRSQWDCRRRRSRRPPAATVTFDAFVAARSPALLRSAYLLTGDPALAEDLLQTSWSKVWPRWDRLVGQATRSPMSAGCSTPRTRRGGDGSGPLSTRRPISLMWWAPTITRSPRSAGQLLDALATLPRGQRAVVVLGTSTTAPRPRPQRRSAARSAP